MGILGSRVVGKVMVTLVLPSPRGLEGGCRQYNIIPSELENGRWLTHCTLDRAVCQGTLACTCLDSCSLET